MSRRAKKIEKRVILDPKYNSELVAHMIRVIMKDGKKTVAERIVYGAIDKVAEQMKEDPSKFVKDEKAFEDPLEVISAAIDAMKPQVEVKTRRVGGTTYPVPVPSIRNARPPLDVAVRFRATWAGHAHRRRRRAGRRVPGPWQCNQEARRRAQNGSGQQGVRALCLVEAGIFPTDARRRGFPRCLSLFFNTSHGEARWTRSS